MPVDKDINVLSKACPLPLITLAKEVRGMQKGQKVRILGNDPLFEVTVIDFCHERGHEILETNHDGKKVTIIFTV